MEKSNLEDAVAILRIICGASVVALLFQEQIHGIIIFVVSFLLIRLLRIMGEEQ